jgi:ATP-binding cassette subfamily F protein 3
MLTAHRISKSYNINTILKDVSFSLNPGDRAGLVGPNGCGKTTLLKILTGIEEPDEGIITLSPPNLAVGYLAQGFYQDTSLSIDNLIENPIGDISAAGKILEEAASALTEDPDNQDLQTAYVASLERFYQTTKNHTDNTSKILPQLGLSNLSGKTLVKELSGGQKTRLALAIVLMRDPKLLLLDEPTNHLDIQILKWLEDWINSFNGAVMIVSHDRTFLDRTVNRILYLDPQTHSTREYTGNYSSFIDQFISERQKQEAIFRDQVYEIRKMQQDIAHTKQQALQVELSTTSRQPGPRRIAKKVAKKAKSRENKLQRYINSDDRIDKPKKSWQMKLELPNPSHQSQTILRTENLSIGYMGYEPLHNDLNLHISSGSRVVLTGPNGSGKTTLLRTIAGHLKPLGGILKLGHSVVLGYMSQEQEMLNPELTPLDTLQRLAPLNETDVRSYLHYYLFSGDDALRKIQDLSYGERARLALAKLVIQGCNFLLLDEPINHLDIPSRSQFELALTQFQGSILAVVHDRYFIRQFANILWTMDEQGVLENELVVA